MPGLPADLTTGQLPIQAVRPLRPDPVPLAAEDCFVRLNFDSLHDLMSPVNQVRTMADLILEKHRGSLDQEMQVLLGFVQKAAGRLQNLLAGLRTYMRVVGSGSGRRLCDANALLAGALASIQQSIDHHGAVVTHDPLPEVYCDASQMMHTFAGLVQNSIQFRQKLTPEIHVSASSDGTAWLFSVRDNGIGVDLRNRERIFGVFKRVDNEAWEGPGIGLAIARHIIEQHGGRIWLDSQPGLGTTFFFTLPRGAPETG